MLTHPNSGCLLHDKCFIFGWAGSELEYKDNCITRASKVTIPHPDTYPHNYPEPIHTITHMVNSIDDGMHVCISDLCKSCKKAN